MCLETEDALSLCLETPQVLVNENDAEVALRALQSMLLETISQTAKEEEEYQAQQKVYENVHQELIDC